MRNLAIIPARSGSKGLKDKNIKLLDGRPLMAYSILTAKESEIFDEIMVSTDSQKYATIAREYGAAVPFLRSAEQSGDRAGSWDTVKEVLVNYREAGQKFDTICLLQPTSPLRVAKDIQAGYNELNKKQADAITAVCEVEHSPLRTMTLPEDGSLREFRKKGNALQRQQLVKYYRINGALYIRKIQYTEADIEILDEKEYAYIMETIRSVDIDTLNDFYYAEYLFRGGIAQD